MTEERQLNNLAMGHCISTCITTGYFNLKWHVIPHICMKWATIDDWKSGMIIG